MPITLPLKPHEEAKLIALARSKGLSVDDLVGEVIARLLSDTPASSVRKEPTRSLRGLLAKYGTAPSAEEIDENRAQMFDNFPRTDF